MHFGSSLQHICTQLLENRNLDLSTSVAQTHTFQITSKDSFSYGFLNYSCFIIATQEMVAKINSELCSSTDVQDDIFFVIDHKKLCYFCGIS